MSRLRHEHFTVQGAPGEPDARSQEFVRALDQGFLEPVREEALEIGQLDRFRAAGTVLTGVYDDAQDPRAQAAARPVATFGDYEGSLCVAPGSVVPTRMVTEVTVRSSHRRRGILRTMMTSALQRFADEGSALAALTASEDSIYGRFGYGVAALSTEITVDVSQGLRLRPASREAIATAGLRTFVPSEEAFPALYEEAFAAFQAATPGQTGVTEAYRRRAAGEANPWAVKGEDHVWRPTVVVDDAGRALGYAITTYSWDENPTQTMQVVDLAAEDELAELALWEALGATDLVHTLRWRNAPIDFFLPQALAHPRDVSFGSRRDHLWLRVLDVAEAFRRRGLAQDGDLELAVEDALGHAQGRWIVTQREGTTTVAAVPEGAPAGAPVLELDAETLAEVYLGTAAVSSLVKVGRAACAVEDLARIEDLLRVAKAPRNTYGF